MTFDPLLIVLPTADRRRAYDFYRRAFALEAVGERADDGAPEPLQFVLNDRTRLMMVPTEGFGWVIGGREVAPESQAKCALGISAATDDEVVTIVDRACQAGATASLEPGPQPWGYAAAIVDPDGHVWTVTATPLTGA